MLKTDLAFCIYIAFPILPPAVIGIVFTKVVSFGDNPCGYTVMLRDSGIILEDILLCYEFRGHSLCASYHVVNFADNHCGYPVML